MAAFTPRWKSHPVCCRLRNYDALGAPPTNLPRCRFTPQSPAHSGSSRECLSSLLSSSAHHGAEAPCSSPCSTFQKHLSASKARALRDTDTAIVSRDHTSKIPNSPFYPHPLCAWNWRLAAFPFPPIRLSLGRRNGDTYWLLLITTVGSAGM